MILISKHCEKIISNAKVVYNQKASNDTAAKYVKSALGPQMLEILCDEYKNKRSVRNATKKVDGNYEYQEIDWRGNRI